MNQATNPYQAPDLPESSQDLAESTQSTQSTGPMPAAEKSRGVAILFAILITWCALIAFGSFQTQASTDFRRPLIVVLTMGTFLSIWALALRSKKVRQQKRNA